MLTFGYLIIDQRPADLVTFPDGAVELHPSGGGAGVAAEWNAARAAEVESEPVPVEPAAEPDEDEIQATLEELNTAWEAALADLERESSTFGNPAGRRAAFLRRTPKPTREDALEKLRTPSPRPRRRAAGARNSARTEPVDACWWATLEADAAGFDGPVQGPGPLPRKAIAQLLGRLSQKGWDVRHVSEERAAVHGREQSTAVCVGMNVMLSRPNDQ
jgi:hypothetical protein